MAAQKNGLEGGAPVRLDGTPRAVLVVDDDPIVGRTLQRVLESAGYDVSVANDGNTAVATLLERPFDVVLSDIQMPGMTGVELLSIVRAHELDVPVILMTGAPTVETAMEAVSLGATHYLQKPTPMDVLLRAIDKALRRRLSARPRRESSSPGASNGAFARERAAQNATLDRALDRMWMAFQPIVDAERRCVFGHEALMRTREPSFTNPGAILAAAERLGRLGDVGARVRALCARDFEEAPPDALLFVNLHPHDLLDPDLYEESSPLTKIADRVVLEITERSAIEDVSDIQNRLAQLRRLGYRIAIDDLGAGYAGLSSFVALGPEIVKLDMSLVRDVHRSDIRQRVVGSLASLCSGMGIRVVAEGVESREERDSVRGLGCALLQGYLFARPGQPFPVPENY